MLNQESIAAVRAARFGHGLTRPLYESYNFSRLPGTIQRLLCGQADPALPPLPESCLPPGMSRADHVIFVLIDGLGWDKLAAGLNQAGLYPATALSLEAPDANPAAGHRPPRFAGLRRFMEHGTVSALTSQFPSTTVVHSVTMASGLPPGQAGCLEWFYHEPRLGRVIAPFLMSYAGDRVYGSVKADGFGPADIFPPGHFPRRLKEAGVTSYVYTNAAFTPSDFSRRMHQDAVVVPTLSPAAAFAQVRQNLAATPKGWHFLYLDSFDTLEHRLGATSPVALAEAENFFLLLDDFITSLGGACPANSLLLVTADHGQVDQRPADAIYLNRLWPGLADYLQTGRDGSPLVAAGGGGRSLNLHLKPGVWQTVQTRLRQLLAGRAEVFSHQELLAINAYGPGPLLPDLAARAGDLVVLPEKDEAVWWFEAGRFDVHNHGNHGGLSNAEMEVFLLALRLDGDGNGSA
ncbi:MAG: hypothetical protein A2087_06535 [Spirochaetes bacterium GWD1_61_31]|nr:MAG: hypothetical protein A2Y37_08935 [Spirochaetes bacterium GWB1_60_80]OHD31896.1 MAG: hypothetical protein A2004_10320 [Spirochaetes bacterium GWC1_61_12]OHD40007.1 MAG: hypothetical protein A2087_06535 [Spirochaetes bacterium GWD1_61_31]OHD42339.1 MAG: hypothetical protein A2Y35_11465 [Spirochaetes bacterium GWE1_60_18]OHD60511.1 MAG: hypothetical protein A2Y32_03680 [Spirochaetes bacterium GWF1_60_12]HAW86949.1 hypothetical protein [Spirochaetaceae bacterium]